MFLRFTLFTSFILFSCQVFYGQSTFPYDREWKLIDSLINKKNLPRSALAEVNKVYIAAKKEHQEAQWVKAIIYKNHLEETDDNIDITLTIKELGNEITNAPPRVAALLKSVGAEQLFQYLQGHRYQFRNRTTIVTDTASAHSDTSSDISTWTIDRLNQKIRSLYLASLSDPALLQKTSLEEFNPVLIKGSARDLRPTLYDLLSWRALDYFQSDPGSQPSSAGDILLENPYLYSEAPFFMHYGFPTTDSLSNFLTAIKIYQQLIRFHAKDIRLDAWIDADIHRIQFVYKYVQMEDKDSLYMRALGRITRQLGTLSASAGAWYLQAQWWATRADSYNPFGDSSHRYDYLNAIEICEHVLINPESNTGRQDCEILLKNIRRQSYHLNLEKVNLPGLPFRALVTYKNLDRLYGRIIRIDDATKESFERNNYDLKSWSKWIQMPYEKNFSQVIPKTSDFQPHRVEIRIDALPIGQYALLTCSDSAFSEKGLIGLTTFFCSGIAYVENGNDYFVVDRESGHPLQNVKVETFIQQNNNKGIFYLPGKAYLTDIHGYFRITPEKMYYDQKMEFYNGKDYLSTSKYISYYTADTEEDEKKLTDNIFTDRSIYRPSQTVHFKGLLVSRDTKTKRYKPANQQSTRIFLMDVNGQKIDSLVLISNEFGSIQGSFKLPQGLMNGDFHLFDEKTEDAQSFSVEEYKRPSFYVEYDSVKGSYRVGDTVHMTGSALAYAGNSIDGASLRWRVIRESRFPYPWLFRFVPAGSETEIAHGEAVTDSKGKFNVHFVALADKSVNRISKPVYTYRIESTVTDAGGESRTATTTVAASYQSFEIVTKLPERSGILRDSLKMIPVTTQNVSGSFIKERLTFSVYALKSPSRMIRKRYWDQPDQFIMTEQEFIQAFPHDEYQDESDVKSWMQGDQVFRRTDSTNQNGLFEIDDIKLTTLAPAWYLFEFKAQDKNGEFISDRRYVQIVANAGKTGFLSYNPNPSQIISALPGETAKIQTGSDAKDLFTIRVKAGLRDSASRYSFYALNQETKDAMVEIKESDRGGFVVNDVFVKDNRWYMSEHLINVPWTNKQLKISYLTWKDKTHPGSPEKWKIQISGNKKDLIIAEVLTSMYDASLDQFKNHSWNIPDLYPVFNGANTWDGRINFDAVNSWMRPAIESPSIPIVRNSYDELIHFDTRRRIPFGPVTDAPFPGDFSQLRMQANMDIADGADKNGMYAMERAKFSPPGVGKTKIEYEAKHENQGAQKDHFQIRKNFNETAFFQPDLKTDAQGNVEISFTMPDALTRWKWMVLTNTRDLSFGYSEKMIVTQKELMVQTNMPRFFREGDTMLLPVKISNLASREMTGTLQLEWLNAENNQSADLTVGNLKSTQPFSVSTSQSGVIFFPTIIPAHFTQPLLYRIVAKTNVNGTGLQRW